MRTIAITGATGGIAKALVAALPEDRLILMGRNLDKLTALYGQRANTRLIAYDLADDRTPIDLIETLAATETVDVFVNNAGFGEFKDYDAFTTEQVKAMFQVNTFSAMAFSREMARIMVTRGQGQIMNVVSIAGLVATSKSSVYAASKFAMIGFSNALRLEVADQGVAITTINPGPVKTEFFDQADPNGDYLDKVGGLALTPQRVAKAMVKAMDKPRRQVNLPWQMALSAKFTALFPGLSDYLSRKVFNYK